MRFLKRRPRAGICILACAVVALGIGACGGNSGRAVVARDAGYREVPSRPNPPLKTVELRSGGVSVLAEVAASPEERERGLMFRSALPEGRGMLFVFETDERLAFWMKNTTIPLSLAYLAADGTIREIRDLEPLSLAPVQSERSVRYALEVPRGWFERAGLKPGDRFDIPAKLLRRD